MSNSRTSIALRRRLSAFPSLCARPSPPWPAISADALQLVREPVAWVADLGPACPPHAVLAATRLAACGVAPDDWTPPGWLLPHQREAARRLAAALRIFGGAVLADAVGLGKSYVALALASRHAITALVVPAAIRAQWRDLLASYGISARLVTHEALSRGARLPDAPLLVVDEAHRFRDPTTRRYDTLARQVRASALLLMTATPVVNRAADLVHLVRLFLADHALAALGVPSLERAAAEGELTSLVHALGPLVIARSAETAGVSGCVPPPHDAPLLRPPTVEPPVLRDILPLVGGLRFPSFGPDAAGLLRKHLAARLASSPEAFRESLRRHRTYVERAAAAARRGAPLSRAAARALFGPDESPQLELVLGAERPCDATGEEWAMEGERLTRLLATLANAGGNPKFAALSDLLRRRCGRKTLVFTTARVTATALAAALGWERVATAASRQARIASGVVPVHEAFALFAPRAQGRSRVPDAARVDVLIATDLASEGLNLQDADGVVHYDLPWTPLRLEQRLGRIARLGSDHAAVAAWWFAPPPELEDALGLTSLIAAKSRTQIALGVARTSTVGRAGVAGGAFDTRERFSHGARTPCRGHAVVRGGCGFYCVLRWRGRGGDMWELIPSAGLPPWPSQHPDFLTPAAAPPARMPHHLLDDIRVVFRQRIIAAQGTSRHPEARRLARVIATRARAAARDRDRRSLGLLDQALARVHEGLAVGAERELGDALQRDTRSGLPTWLRSHPPRHPLLSRPTLEAALLFVD